MNENTGAVTQEAREEAKRRVAKIDFKMVTFALAGKEYGIDIMSVKEIAKAGRFTYVPNASNFVRGVYNLRGEIISVIDLRTMFHLPAERKEDDALENLLILKVEEHVFGVIVDSIDKVVGISNETIQPPHPIFGDINVKYIRGVVENSGRLYIILDIAKIFAPKEADEERKGDSLRMAESARLAESSRADFSAQAEVSSSREGSGDLELNFIKETLFTFKHFGVSRLNEAWVEKRFGEWKKQLKGKDLQLKEAEDADMFLEGFYSPHTAGFWDEAYMSEAMALLPDMAGKTVSAWNPGCGRGYESYSFAIALRERYPDSRIKIWANDSDLLNISMAPNVVFESEDIPALYAKYAVKSKSGMSFNAAIRDSISFEYHDVLNANPLPEVDFILCRDVLSFMAGTEQGRIVAEFQEKLKPNGLLFLGANEDLSGSEGWKAVGSGPVRAFARQA